MPSWNVHAAAEGNGEVGKVPADAHSLIICLPGSAGRARALVIEVDEIVDIVANRLNAGPARRRAAEELPCRIGKHVRLTIAATHQEYQRFLEQFFHRVLPGRGVRTTSGKPESLLTPSPLMRNRPGGATIRLHQFPKRSR